MPTEQAPVAGAGKVPARDPESVPELLAGVWRSVVAELGGTAELFATEGRLAALSLAGMLGLAMAAVAFVLATWLALAGALTVWLIGLGYSPALVLLGVGAANLLLVWLAWIGIRFLSGNLLFSRTRRRLETHEDRRAEPPYAVIDRPQA